ncbi:broad specificity phosphatase PhoE [Naumannella cuiyingiana]|uniref:Broad specificity phosphatase PhoE n=1 Tax=Naumannella cuiyingiana TaxID=1347891 RepID=A0A7Z0D9Y1_9ACTN|nr:histidine phosphatase family protein [Naumannella cuiyingiana]NYI71502.1 broad specificity phosphatase PhoE [Naumannella cuiyingiana]
MTDAGDRVVVHLVRHGEVDNPDGVLYGRLPDYHLSGRGREMAERVAEHTADWPITHLRSSPLERAQETMAPIAALRPDLRVVTDDRVIEAANRLEGRVFSAGASALRDPRVWWHLRNPLRPSWGEAYRSIVARMRTAIRDAADAAGPGGQALIVSHQLPIWMARSAAEGRRLVHDPRRRETSLASITSFVLRDGRIAAVSYAEPAADLLPVKRSRRKFVAGA